MTSPWCPADIVGIASLGLHLSPLFMVTPFSLCFAFGTLESFGWVTKFYFFAPLSSPTEVSVLLSLRRHPASSLTAFCSLRKKWKTTEKFYNYKRFFS
jgi:hypothetical protein